MPWRLKTHEQLKREQEAPAPRAPDPRPSAAERGYDTAWRKSARAFLAKNPLCRECEQHGKIEPATLVDHIVPRRLGGQDREPNLQPLCRWCHAKKTAEETKARRRG